jgi:hypothetical protein
MRAAASDMANYLARPSDAAGPLSAGRLRPPHERDAVLHDLVEQASDGPRRQFLAVACKQRLTIPALAAEGNALMVSTCRRGILQD